MIPETDEFPEHMPDDLSFKFRVGEFNWHGGFFIVFEVFCESTPSLTVPQPSLVLFEDPEKCMNKWFSSSIQNACRNRSCNRAEVPWFDISERGVTARLSSLNILQTGMHCERESVCCSL